MHEDLPVKWLLLSKLMIIWEAFKKIFLKKKNPKKKTVARTTLALKCSLLEKTYYILSGVKWKHCMKNVPMHTS